jgi:hypothetical protein
MAKQKRSTKSKPPKQLPPELVSRDETRDLVGELLLSDDLLGEPSPELQQVLNEFGPKPKTVFQDGKQTGTILVQEKPCPAHLRDTLDLAIGRSYRRRIQGATIDDWIETVAGFDLTKPPFPRAVLERAMNLYREKTSAVAVAGIHKNRPGKKPDKLDRVTGAIVQDIDQGKLTVSALAGGLKQTTLMERYKTSTGTFRAARKKALAELKQRNPTELRQGAKQLRQNSDNERNNSDRTLTKKG